MRLDVRVVTATRLDDVGIQRPLYEIAHVAEVARRFFEHADEQLADRLALALGVDDVVERREEAICGLHVHELDFELLTKRLLDLFRLSEPQQPCVDEHADQLVADRLVHERRRDRGVDAARQAADDALRTYLGPDLRHRVLDDRDIRPRRAATGRVVEERLEDFHPVFGVHHLGMELHSVDAAVAVLERGNRHRIRTGRHGEPVGRQRDGVAVTHPHDLVDGKVREQQRRSLEVQLGPAVLADPGLRDFAPKIARDELCPIADAEDRHARVVDRGVDAWCPVDVHRGRTAREDDGPRPPFEHVGDRHRPGNDLAVHVRLADAPGDELRVLRPEIDDQNDVERVAHCAGRELTGRSFTGRPSRCPVRVAATCPRSSTRARPSPRPSGIPSRSRSRSSPSTCEARRTG